MIENSWQKYCVFLEKDFKLQVTWNENYLLDYLKEWEHTKMAKQLCPRGIKVIEGIPLTDYSDYPILHEYGAMINELKKTIPRKRRENFCDYYDKLGRKIINILDGWMADRYSFGAMTSGTTGESKWFVNGETYWKNMVNSFMSLVTISCSDEFNNSHYKKGDRMFGIGAPAPYFGGYVSKILNQEGIQMIPPTADVDEEPDFMKKIQMALKYVKNIEKIDILAGSGSIIKLTALYFTNKAELLRGTYRTTSPGIKKIALWFIWNFIKFFFRKTSKLKDFINPKGIVMGGFDAEMYHDYINGEFGFEPTNFYGATEIGFVMYGRPGNKFNLFPDLRTGYFEFLDTNGHIWKIDELEKGGIYELVFTPYRAIVVRYKTGDVLKVIDFQEDGCPIFGFESRTINILDVHNYYRLTMSIAFQAFKKAGFPASNNWAFTKEFEPTEHLVLLMEDEWDLTEKQMAARICNALKAVDKQFNNYISDFKITNPMDAIKVIYLKNGAFKRYMLYKIKQGVSIGNLKPLRIISPEKKDIINILRSA